MGKLSRLVQQETRMRKVHGHAIRVTAECSLKRLLMYRIPITLQEEVDRETSELFEQGWLSLATKFGHTRFFE